MRLVVDTNILFSFFRENPVRSVIINASALGLKLYIPELALDELKTNQESVHKYAKINEEQFELMVSTLRSFVEVVPLELFSACKEQAQTVSPDPKDAPFFALALQLNAALWSNEPRLKRQAVVKVLSTKELLNIVPLVKRNGNGQNDH